MNGLAEGVVREIAQTDPRQNGTGLHRRFKRGVRPRRLPELRRMQGHGNSVCDPEITVRARNHMGNISRIGGTSALRAVRFPERPERTLHFQPKQRAGELPDEPERESRTLLVERD